MKRNQPIESNGIYDWWPAGRSGGFQATTGPPARFDVPSGWAASWCPYGKPGDHLWVRESFYTAEPYSWGTDPSGEAIEYRGVPRNPVHYAADGRPENTPNNHYPNGLRGGAIAAPDPNAIWKPRPSIYMPRRASRITLEITEVRVERLQLISGQDALNEGFINEFNDPELAISDFLILWDKINSKKYPWDSNPWVWVISFKRTEA
jgi:hypothetical protein